MNMKIQISDSVTLKQVLRKVKDEDESVKAAKKLVKMLLLKVSDSKNKTEFSEEERKKLAEEGLALPDGSFPIRNKQDLKDAIKAIGLARSYSKTKKWIIKRARELDALDLLPEKWKVKDSTSDSLEKLLDFENRPSDIKELSSDEKEEFKPLLDMIEGWKSEGALCELVKEKDYIVFRESVWRPDSVEHNKEVKEYMEDHGYQFVDDGYDIEQYFYFKKKVSDSNAVTLDRDDNWGNGTRVYMLFQDEEGKPERSYGKIMGYSVNAGTANIRWEDDYEDMYDVDWSLIYKAD